MQPFWAIKKTQTVKILSPEIVKKAALELAVLDNKVRLWPLTLTLKYRNYLIAQRIKMKCTNPPSLEEESKTVVYRRYP
jgi:hypothetical protein